MIFSYKHKIYHSERAMMEKIHKIFLYVDTRIDQIVRSIIEQIDEQKEQRSS
jgi:phosphopantetheine adenylyltransferase